MPIKMTTDKNAIGEEIRNAIEAKRDAILYTLAYVGEEAVNMARTSHTYKDQTGNLTASIGYIVIDGGEVASIGNFNTVSAPQGNGEQGTENGEAYARSLAAEFVNGITLVVVAGMKYASYVADKGYDVLASGQIRGEQLASEMLNKLTKD